MPEDVVLPIPNLALPQNLFVLSQPHLAHLHENARKELLEGVQADRMSTLIADMNPSLTRLF